MGIYDEAREAIREAFAGKWERVHEVFNAFIEGDIKHFARVPGSTEWEEIFRPVAKVTVFTMSMMPVAVDSSVYTPFAGDVAFYDVAEALMATYVFGQFSVRYMPRARIIMQRTGKRIDVTPLKKFLDKLGVMRDNILTGIGQALTKALIYGATNRTSTVVESVYLSTLIAYTLHAEMKQINEESVRMFLLETIARYKRISSTIREWQRNAPKLFLRELPIHYNWEDAVKDVALILVDKNEDFRFTT